MANIRDILHFSFPEVESPHNVPLLLYNEPSHYRDFLKKSIKLFIDFMVKYVKKNESEPDLVPMIESFFRRMEYKWADFSKAIIDGSYAKITGEEWPDYDITTRRTPGVESKVTVDKDFRTFFERFLNLIKAQGRDDLNHISDLNQLISIVLLGGFQNISYYIGESEIPANIPRSAVIRDRGVTRIDMRKEYDHSRNFFTQILRDPSETWQIKNADLFRFPLFVELAAVIVKQVKHPELLEQFADSDAAVDNAVDVAVDNATVKWHESKTMKKERVGWGGKEAKEEKEAVAGKRRKRTRHARSGHKKRSSNKRSGNKRSGNKRSGNKRMSRRR
jgi:hypothetical protein